MLPRYRAAQWMSFAFGVIALALGVICFRGVGVLGYCTPQPASIPEIEKEECLDERIASPDTTVVTVILRAIPNYVSKFASRPPIMGEEF